MGWTPGTPVKKNRIKSKKAFNMLFSSMVQRTPFQHDLHTSSPEREMNIFQVQFDTSKACWLSVWRVPCNWMTSELLKMRAANVSVPRGFASEAVAWRDSVGSRCWLNMFLLLLLQQTSINMTLLDDFFPSTLASLLSHHPNAGKDSSVYLSQKHYLYSI